MKRVDKEHIYMAHGYRQQCGKGGGERGRERRKELGGGWKGKLGGNRDICIIVSPVKKKLME